MIKTVGLNLLIDLHPPIKDEQHKDHLITNGLVDVVAFLENNAANPFCLVVEVPNKGIAAQVFQHETINFILKTLRLVLRVVLVV